MVSDLPNYDIILATAQLGFKNPADRRWRVVNTAITNEQFIKHDCNCLSRQHKSKDVIEIIMKSHVFPNLDKEKTYFFGQCPVCESIYWCEL